MITEDPLEQLAIQWHGLGRNIEHRTLNIERRSEEKRRLAEAVRRLNPKLPESAVEEVVHGVTKPEHPSLVQNNRAFHHYLKDWVLLEFTNSQGEKEAD